LNDAASSEPLVASSPGQTISRLADTNDSKPE